MSERGGWRAVPTGDGSVTLAHPVHGEACHALEGAWTQARERYAAGCRLRERALELRARGVRVLRLLDVGTGLGLNLAAALEALDGTHVALDATTLEIDERVIRAMLAIGVQPRADLERFHAPVRAALERALALAPGSALDFACTGPCRGGADAGADDGRGGVGELDGDAPDPVDRIRTAHARADPIAHERVGPLADARSGPLADEGAGPHAGVLRLHLGDARTTLPALDPTARFDAVFLDPFSPRVDPPLWERACLAAIASRMERGGLLSTYSAAVSVRAGLLAAGLCVGPGARVQRKAAGTLAGRDVELAAFDARTQRRLVARAAGGPSGADAGGNPVRERISSDPML